MRYFCEVTTIKEDGTEIYWRKRARDFEDARAQQLQVAAGAIHDPLKELAFIEDGKSLRFLNDYGGYSIVRAVMYGDMSQIKEGIFVL